MNNQNNQYPLGGYNQQYQYNQQGMPVGNQMYNTSKKKSVFRLDLVALLIGIISMITCSGCFVFGIMGIVISIVVLADNSGRYGNKIKAIIGLILSLISLVMMLIVLLFGNFTDTSIEKKRNNHISTLYIIRSKR